MRYQASSKRLSREKPLPDCFARCRGLARPKLMTLARASSADEPDGIRTGTVAVAVNVTSAAAFFDHDVDVIGVPSENGI